MFSRPKAPLGYERLRKSLHKTTIRRFEDGGVTILIPPQPGPSKRLELATAGLGIAVLVGALWAAGAPPWRLPTVLLGAFQGLYHVPAWFIITVGVPLLFWAWRMFRSTRLQCRPTVIGINRDSVYVEIPGAILDRTFEVSRKHLRTIEVVHYKGIVLKHPRCVAISIEGKEVIWICVDRPVSEIIDIGNVLKSAQKSTAV